MYTNSDEIRFLKTQIVAFKILAGIEVGVGLYFFYAGAGVLGVFFLIAAWAILTLGLRAEDKLHRLLLWTTNFEGPDEFA